MKTVICAIIKDERPYIKEWVEYHLNLGFDHIYLYEDYGSDSHADIVEEYSNVTLKRLGKDVPIKDYYNTKTQVALYNWFLNKCKQECIADWVLYTDIDEFLTFEDDYNLKRLCEEFKDETGVWLGWRFYTANGHISKPKGGVVENYTEEASPEEVSDKYGKIMIKSFVNVHLATRTTVHIVPNGVNVNHQHDWNKRIFKKAWINHYFTKSFEEYCYRMFKRGNMSNNFRTFDNFFKCNKKMLPLKKKLINSIRHRHTINTFWISKDLKIISGGNQGVINRLKKSFAKIIEKNIDNVNATRMDVAIEETT